jgi:hypothetical protein
VEEFDIRYVHDCMQHFKLDCMKEIDHWREKIIL